MKKILAFVLEFLPIPLVFGAVFFICFSGYNLYLSVLEIATAAFSFGIVLLFFALITRFKKFRGFGFEAELWESKQEEAELLVDSLRKQAVLLSRNILDFGARLGRVDTWLPPGELFKLADDVEASLREIGASQEEIHEAKEPFYRIIAIEMAHLVAIPYNSKIEEKIKENHKYFENANLEKKNQIQRDNAELNDKKINFRTLSTELPSIQGYEKFMENIRNSKALSDAEITAFFEQYKEEMEDLKLWIFERNLRRKQYWCSK